MTHDELEAIEARCNTATPGPWKFEHTPYSDDPIRVGNSEYIICHSVLSKRDANFIAQAGQDVSALIAEVKRLKRELDAAKADIHTAIKSPSNICDLCFKNNICDMFGRNDSTVRRCTVFKWRGVQEADNAGN